MTWHLQLQMRLGTLKLDVDLSGNSRTVALIGPNGAGKSTLLRTIAGAHQPTSGRIEIAGNVLLDTASGIDLPPERRRIAYVPQGYGLFPHLTALDNVAFGASRSLSRTQQRKAACTLLEEMECADLADRKPGQLSGGEQQRVALARAMLIEPHMMLLDEPLSALDVPARRVLRRFLAERLADHARPAIVVTHDARDVHALDAVVCAMEDGQIVQQGNADALRSSPSTEFVAEFFGA